MSELKEIEVIYKVKIATYKSNFFNEHQTDILQSFQCCAMDWCRSGVGIMNNGTLIIKGEE